MGYLSYLEPSDVKDLKSFANYASQEIGIPSFAGQRQHVAYASMVKKVFAQYPAADWQTLVKVVAYVKANHKRPPTMAALVGEVRYAWSKGYLTELDPRQTADPRLEHLIEGALQVETDETWRHKLMAGQGSYRRKIFELWEQERQWQLV